MKKVIGVVFASAFAIGMAFADTSISIQYRTRMSAYTQTKDGDDNKTTTWFDQTGYDKTKDEVTFKANTDYAGVVLGVDPYLWTTKGTTTNSTTAGTASFMQLDEYWAWLNFGGLKFTAGAFDSRYTNRLNVCATEINLTDDIKYGVSKYLTTTSTSNILSKDVGDISNWNGDTTQSFIAGYTMKDVIPGTLLVQAGLVTHPYTTDASSTDDVKYQYSGYVFDAGYKQDGLFDAELIFKAPEEKQFVFAAFLSPLMVKNLKATFGFTYGSDSDDNLTDSNTYNGTKGYKHTEYAIDARFVYAVTDALNTVLQANYSSYKPDGEDAETGMYVLGEVSYVVNDKFTAAFDGGIYMNDLDDNDESDICENYFKIEPALKFTAGKGATLNAGLLYQKAINDGDASGSTETKSSIKIPVVLRVKL